MTTPKQQLVDALKRLPDGASIAELVAEFHFAASILRGLDDIEHGRVLTQEEVEARLIEHTAIAGRLPLIRPKDRRSCVSL